MNEGKPIPELEQLLEHLKSTRGFDFTAYKRSTLARRIDKRLATINVGSYTDYVDYLEVHPDEFGQLFNAILINVTTFFRDPETFEYLRNEVVPTLLQNREREEHLRVWSAGCASGEECYSIAILLAEVLGSEQFRQRVKIYATDIDEEELAMARAGSYSDRQMEDLPEDLRTKYFDRNGNRSVFKKDFRRNIIFGRHDLLDDAPISRVDLLMCRNTLMYFNHDAQSRIVSRFRFALREGGYLVLGKAEMLLNFANAFAPSDLKQRIFVRLRNEEAADRLHGGYPVAREERTPAASHSNRLREIALDQDPTAQLVLDGDGRVQIANLQARELFGLNARDVGRPLQDLEASYRPVELRSCIDDAHVRRQVVHVRDVTWPLANGETRHFNVQISPLLDSHDTSLGTKIIFQDVSRQHELQHELHRSRRELETAYEELQSANEELETTNEELQSTVEELETTNEELQSTNEELETMNEELQSTNEELETVNQELRQRGVDLGRSNVFLSGILKSVSLGVVVLNEELHVELWNDVATDLWGLRQDEVQGKHFFGLDIGLPVEQLREPILALLKSPERTAELNIDATNRRGRHIGLRVSLAHVGTAERSRGVIMLMQEVDVAVH
jgi:two-component system, chemotaxis family, CheB/CheR fusion protein